MHPRRKSGRQSYLCINKAAFSILDKLFKSAHAIAKKSRPMSDYSWHCQLDIQKGLDHGQTYLNNTSCKEFMKLNLIIEQHLAEAPFCTLMSDGSTDVSITENEITAPLYSKTITLLDELFKFNHKSALHTKKLKDRFSALSISQTLPSRIGGTRCVGHVETALKSVKNGYKAFVALKNSGQSATQSKAKALLKLLKSKDVMTFVLFLSDVVAILGKLSSTLQKRNTCLYEVHQAITSTVSYIKELHNRYLCSVLQLSGGGFFPDLRFFIGCGYESEGELLTGNADNFAPQKSRVITSLVQSINNRFKDIDVGVMQCTKITDLAKLQFGDEHFATIVDHYRANLIRTKFDVTSVEAEWTKLMTSLYENHKVKK
ncbi:hypothetical protein KUTeg_017536 [Tegillarca granosa]|uniref:Uncharacterized protein n=1 Tax=Tegillarca granosa TaxID=220873 RepID=A0ABQ9EF65_TEGGR|nr:hypothetical protein KUTeg_017536 [Tegillarca granosa]